MTVVKNAQIQSNCTFFFLDQKVGNNPKTLNMFALLPADSIGII